MLKGSLFRGGGGGGRDIFSVYDLADVILCVEGASVALWEAMFETL